MVSRNGSFCSISPGIYSVILIFLSLSSFYPFLLTFTSEHNRTLPEEDLGDEEQRLALHVIKEKCNFVPEHVEKRTLRNFMTQNISMVYICTLLTPSLSMFNLFAV